MPFVFRAVEQRAGPKAVGSWRFWANNAVKGKKGFQPTNRGEEVGGKGEVEEHLAGLVAQYGEPARIEWTPLTEKAERQLAGGNGLGQSAGAIETGSGSTGVIRVPEGYLDPRWAVYQQKQAEAYVRHNAGTKGGERPHVSEPGDIKGTVTHEYGHVLLARLKNNYALRPEIDKTLRRVRADPPSGRAMDAMPKGLNAHHHTEAFAEAFVLYQRGSDPYGLGKLLLHLPNRTFSESLTFTDVGDPEWKIVHSVAERHERILAEALVAAFASARRGINVDAMALELTAHGNTGQIDWAVLAKRLSDELAKHIRAIARDAALELLARFRTTVEPPQVFDEQLLQFWANNAIVGKKGFQPKGGSADAGSGADEKVVSKEWADPPPPVGKAGEHKAGGYSSDQAYGTNTALGRVGEKAFVDVAGGKILHAPGKGEQSPLDVRIDGYGFEVKAVSVRSTKYAATPKPYEISQKEAYAKKLGVKPATAIVVVDSVGAKAYAYWRPGLASGRLSANTGWKYLGSTDLPQQHTEQFADPVEKSFETMSLVLRHSAAEEYLRTHLPTLVTNVTTETQEAIRDTILDGFQKGYPPRDMARQIRSMIGVTNPQAKTLMRMIPNWIANGVKPGSDDLVRRVRNQTDKMIRYRALNIARTETLRASNAGQQALWQAATNEGLLQRGVTKREWIATVGSARTCPSCLALDGVKVGMDEAWRSDRGDVTMPPLHPQCRCAMGIAIDTEVPAPPPAERDLPELVQKHLDARNQQLLKEAGPELTQLTSSAINDRLVEGWHNVLTADKGATWPRLRERSEENLAKTLDAAVLSTRRTSTTFDKILEEGRFKSQFETKRSGGVMDPAERAKAEQRLFGYAKRLPVQERPIYGYFRLPTQPTDTASAYGDVLITLKDSVRRRTTVTWTDSLYASEQPSPATAPKWHSYMPRGASLHIPHAEQRGFPYIEAQIHGGLTLDDVAKVQFTFPPRAGTRELLTRAGFQPVGDPLIAEIWQR